MATGLGEPVYGLSEEEVSSCPERCGEGTRPLRCVLPLPAVGPGIRVTQSGPERWVTWSSLLTRAVRSSAWGSRGGRRPREPLPRGSLSSANRVSWGAVGQLSWSCPCSQESVTCVTSGSLQGSLRGAGDLGIAEDEEPDWCLLLGLLLLVGARQRMCADPGESWGHPESCVPSPLGLAKSGAGIVRSRLACFGVWR